MVALFCSNYNVSITCSNHHVYLSAKVPEINGLLNNILIY